MHTLRFFKVCQVKPAPCHPNATCERTTNSFRCKCNQAYTGDGKNCTGQLLRIFVLSCDDFFTVKLQGKKSLLVTTPQPR